MKILAIVNVHAGQGKTLWFAPEKSKEFLRSDHDLYWCYTRSVDEMREYIYKAPSLGVEAILIYGGDGTIHEALPALQNLDLPFAVLPGGRGNDFYRNVTGSFKEINGLDNRSGLLIQNIDLPAANGRPYVCVACVGFDAYVNKLAGNHRGIWSGTLGYIICVVKALRQFKPFNVEIEIDGEVWRGPAMMVSVANGKYYGGGMKIAPDADLSDGFLDVCIIKEISKLNFIRAFPRVFNGSHISHPKVILKRGRTITVKSDLEKEIFADGEYIGHLPLTCRIGNKKLKVLHLN